MRKVYICAPYSGNEEQIAENKRFALACTHYIKDLGSLVPFAPQLYYDQFMGEDEEDMTMEFCKYEVAKSDEMWVFKDPSNGMQKEIQFAQGIKKPIKFCTLPDVYEQATF